jgi:hypothetical protein
MESNEVLLPFLSQKYLLLRDWLLPLRLKTEAMKRELSGAGFAPFAHPSCFVVSPIPPLLSCYAKGAC